MSDTDIFIAKESGSCEIDGQPHIFVKGVTRVRAGHQLLKACPDYFEPADKEIHYDLEQATSGPGETREVDHGKGNENDGGGDEDVPVVLDKMKLAELREYAAKAGVPEETLAGFAKPSTSKKAVIAAIEAHQAAA